MSRKIEEIYHSLAIGIINGIETEWDKAQIFAEYFEDSANFKGEFSLKNNIDFFEVDDQAFEDFEELYEITTEDSENKWNRAKFTLEPTGKFNIDFEWDQELADEIERLNNE
jgi:hypothetical protein